MTNKPGHGDPIKTAFGASGAITPILLKHQMEAAGIKVSDDTLKLMTEAAAKAPEPIEI